MISKLHKLVTVRPLQINAMLQHSCSRCSSSAASKVNPAVPERYDGSIVITGISGRFLPAPNDKLLIQKLNIFMGHFSNLHRNLGYELESNLVETEGKITNALTVFRKGPHANGNTVKMMGLDILKVNEK